VDADRSPTPPSVHNYSAVEAASRAAATASNVLDARWNLHLPNVEGERARLQVVAASIAEGVGPP